MDEQKMDDQKMDEQKMDEQKMDDQKMDEQKMDDQKMDEQKMDIASEDPSSVKTETNDNNMESFKNEHSSTSAKQRTDYTSENFKICIHNLPKYTDPKQLKKFLKRLDLDVKKAYVIRDHAYVCFVDESTVTRALDVLQNYTWKKNILRVKRAAAAVDPVLAAASNSKKVKSEVAAEETPENVEEPEDRLAPEDRLLDAVAPLHKLPYADQLASKQSESERLLKEISRNVKNVADGYSSGLPSSGYIGELKAILASPAINGYRNKCEFSIGYDHEHRPTVGFRLSRYKTGSVEIVSPEKSPHIPESTKRIVATFQHFMLDSGLAPYDVTNKTGFWSMLTVRQFLMDTMVIVTASQRNIDREQVESAKKAVVDLFSSSALENGYRVTCLYFQPFEFSTNSTNYEHLWGSAYVYENLLGLRFRISPGAFFQTNTAACQVLYKAISDICQLDTETLVLDFCCGTGTIGIVLAGKAGKVIGIEMCSEAVEDAKINAKNNERENCEFINGKVENVIDDIRRQMVTGPLARYKRVVGILDPPRHGVPAKVLSNLRQLSALKTVVYVSCDPNAATKNFLDLARRSSNRYPGDAFQLKMVQPVDMFPHTKHCEWILVFER